MTIIKVDVTQECIDKGKKRFPYGCMVHRALIPILRNKCMVTQSRVFLDLDQYESEEVIFPKDVQEKIEAWDRGEIVKPFNFEVDIPDEYLKAIPVESWPVGVSLEMKTP